MKEKQQKRVNIKDKTWLDKLTMLAKDEVGRWNNSIKRKVKENKENRERR